MVKGKGTATLVKISAMQWFGTGQVIFSKERDKNLYLAYFTAKDKENTLGRVLHILEAAFSPCVNTILTHLLWNEKGSWFLTVPEQYWILK